MSNQEEKVSAVAACVTTFAEVETLMEQAKGKIDQLTQLINEAHMLGIGRQGEHLRIVNMLGAGRGRISDGLERVVAAHEKATAVAKREGCDVALPTDGFAIGIMSGGDR